MLKILIPALLLFAEVPAPTPAPPAPGLAVLEVAGSATPLKLTPDLLHRLPRKQISVPASEHGGAASFEGVRLRDLLSEAKVPAGNDISGQYLSWVVIVDAADGYRAVFAGPFVRGVRDDRHLGLIWGDLQADGTLRVFRGAKLRLVDVDPGLIEQALRPGSGLVARIRLTDARGNPICARVHPPYLTWSAAADGAG